MSKATQKGTRFETQVADYMRSRLHMPIERRAKCGSKDRGDISGFRIGPWDCVVECKNRKAMDLPGWLAEAEDERENACASYGVVIHKRRGYGDNNMGGTYVTMTLDTLLDIAGDVKSQKIGLRFGED